MTKSDSIAKLAEALSKAQGSMKNAIKDSDNPFFKSKYADLASVSDACRAELASNGLAIAQLPTMRDGKMVLEYVLMHASGEYIGSEIEMTPVKSDPQGIGSAITYARRYTLAGITGVATEDDDGNAASGNANGKRNNETKEAVTFRKPAAVAVKPPAPAFKPELPIEEGGTDGPSPLDEDEQEAPEVAMSDCITQGQATNFHIKFREALPKKMRDKLSAEDVKQMAHDWLRTQGIVDVLGKPSALAIKKASFMDVRMAAEEYAKSYQI